MHSLWLNKRARKEGTTFLFRAELKSVEVCVPAQQPAHLKRCSPPHATLNHPSGQKHEASLSPGLSAAEGSVSTEVLRPGSPDLHSPKAPTLPNSQGPTSCKGPSECLCLGRQGPSWGGGPFSHWAKMQSSRRLQRRMESSPICGVPQASVLLTISWCTPPPARGNRPQIGIWRPACPRAADASTPRSWPLPPCRPVLRPGAPAGPRLRTRPAGPDCRSPWPPRFLAVPPAPSVRRRQRMGRGAAVPAAAVGARRVAELSPRGRLGRVGSPEC